MNAGDFLLISNNPAACRTGLKVRVIDGSPVEVMRQVRNLVHLGHNLHGHPLAGSNRLWDNPFRSVAVSSRPGSVRARDVVQVEEALSRLQTISFASSDLLRDIDYQEIDFELLRVEMGLTLETSFLFTGEKP